MSLELLLVLILRFIHIAAAMLAIGAPFYVRFALLPAATKTLDDEKHKQLRETINNRWRHIVYLLITLFLITGFINFLVPIRVDGQLLSARWKDFNPEDKRLYHMIFGIKMLAAFAIFFLASALAGRTQTFAPIRKKAKTSLTLLLLLAALLLICSSTLRYLPRNSTPAIVLPANQ
jgi:uncharacterized membrane protein